MNAVAAKDARLEELESMVIGLKWKVTGLEETLQQQELLIKELQKERQSTESIPNNLALNFEPSMGKSATFSRMCRELRASDPSLTSGMHWIDPDGQGVGDDPIYVYCDMTNGTQFIIY